MAFRTDFSGMLHHLTEPIGDKAFVINSRRIRGFWDP